MPEVSPPPVRVDRWRVHGDAAQHPGGDRCRRPVGALVRVWLLGSGAWRVALGSPQAGVVGGRPSRPARPVL